MKTEKYSESFERSFLFAKLSVFLNISPKYFCLNFIRSIADLHMLYCINSVAIGISIGKSSGDKIDTIENRYNYDIYFTCCKIYVSRTIWYNRNLNNMDLNRPLKWLKGQYNGDLSCKSILWKYMKFTILFKVLFFNMSKKSISDMLIYILDNSLGVLKGFGQTLKSWLITLTLL